MNAVRELRTSTGAAACLECGKCSSLCPLAPFGLFSASRAAACRDPLEAGGGQRRALERCLACGLCEVRCPQGVRFVDFVGGLRCGLEGNWPARCSHGDVLRSAARLMATAPAAPRPLDWLDDGPDGELAVAEEGEVGLFVGCLPLFEELFASELGIRPTAIARAAVRILNALGIEPVVVAEERCCGHDLEWSGDGEGFEALARANADAFAARGVRHIVTPCAECARTWRLAYPRAAPGFQPRVEHLSELLAAAVERGELDPAGDQAVRVSYQDPCRLGRHLGVYEAPRAVLAAVPGVELREMPASGQDAVCCGTSGFLVCDAASRSLQLARLDSARATGADTLVTTCPKCWIHFTCAQAGERRRGAEPPAIEVEDLTVLLSKRLTAPTGPQPRPPATEDNPGGAS